MDLKIIVLQSLDPPGHLTLRLLEAEQPGKGSVVCPQKEPPAVEVGAKVFERLNHCQELTPGDAVVRVETRSDCSKPPPCGGLLLTLYCRRGSRESEVEKDGRVSSGSGGMNQALVS